MSNYNNVIFDVNGELTSERSGWGNEERLKEEIKILKDVLRLALRILRIGKDLCYYEVTDEGLTLYWRKCRDDLIEIPFKDSEQITQFLIGWLIEQSPYDYKQEGLDGPIDLDGSIGRGYRVYHIRNMNSICVVKPVCIWYGK